MLIWKITNLLPQRLPLYSHEVHCSALVVYWGATMDGVPFWKPGKLGLLPRPVHPPLCRDSRSPLNCSWSSVCSCDKCSSQQASLCGAGVLALPQPSWGPWAQSALPPLRLCSLLQSGERPGTSSCEMQVDVTHYLSALVGLLGQGECDPGEGRAGPVWRGATLLCLWWVMCDPLSLLLIVWSHREGSSAGLRRAATRTAAKTTASGRPWQAQWVRYKGSL
jgi:hypothetical protein